MYHTMDLCEYVLKATMHPILLNKMSTDSVLLKKEMQDIQQFMLDLILQHQKNTVPTI